MAAEKGKKKKDIAENNINWILALAIAIKTAVIIDCVKLFL